MRHIDEKRAQEWGRRQLLRVLSAGADFELSGHAMMQMEKAAERVRGDHYYRIERDGDDEAERRGDEETAQLIVQAIEASAKRTAEGFDRMFDSLFPHAKREMIETGLSAARAAGDAARVVALAQLHAFVVEKQMANVPPEFRVQSLTTRNER